ncbi:MAG: tetratricopeptide repeat protein [Phycisphaerales bacterium]|nr:MAG: tetratricopeptide repeat protein [Phycisphaerales bacterium]
MMNRRLNKKVALIGSGVFLLLLLAAIAVMLQLGQGPEEHIRDAEAALQAARNAEDEQSKEQNYERAKRSFQRAYGRAKSNPAREEILFRMVDMCRETRDWNYVLVCWDQIIKVNPNNARARYGRLKYFYILADSGSHGAWKEVQEQASEFLRVAESKGLLDEDTAKWDVPEIKEETVEGLRLAPFLYLFRGRAALEMASLGTVTDPDESLARAVDDLKKVQEHDPRNTYAYLNLARAAVTRGELLAARGKSDERDKATEQAVALLEQASQMAEADPSARINLLTLKWRLARDDGSATPQEQVESLEPQFLSLVNTFRSSAKAFAVLSAFYSEYSVYAGPRLGPENLRKAIEAAEKATELDPEDVGYAINAADLHYRNFTIQNDKEAIQKAIDIARKALELPGVQDTTGPRERVNRFSSYRLYSLLANCYIEQVLDARGATESSQAESGLASAEQAVHQIEQLFGSGQEPLVAKWKGMLELAKGDDEAAATTLYAAYEQLKAVMPPQPPWPRDLELAQLSYTLARMFRGTSEIGAVLEFLTTAIYAGVSDVKPEAYLDYVDALLALGYYPDALRNLDAFEEYFGSSERCRQLRVGTYIGAKQYAEAETELGQMPENDPGAVRLRLALAHARVRDVRLSIGQIKREDDVESALQPGRAGANDLGGSQSDVPPHMRTELEKYSQMEGELLEKLVSLEPNSVEEASVINVCGNLISLGRAGQAGLLIQRFSEHYPDSPVVLVYRRILSEPDPANVSPERLRQIEEQSLSSIVDPTRQALELGVFYRRNDELQKAIVQFRKVFETGILPRQASPGSAADRAKFAANHLFDIALGTENWELGEEIAQAARARDLDNCQGQIYAARLAFARSEFKDALVRINECLSQRPLFSYACMLRSDIHAALGNEHASMEDIRKAAALNPMDGAIARGLASTLYRRNEKLGESVSAAQITETKDALLRAMVLNPGDLVLRGLYADYIAGTEPLRAVAIRQDLQKADPSLANAVLLGKLATEVAVKETDTKAKDALFAVAGSAFEQARQTDPSDKRMLYYYAEYFRARGREDEAKRLLEGSQDRKLLWDHYFQTGRYDKAREVLEQLYNSGDKDSGVLKGLVLAAEKTSDKEAVKKYSEVLVSMEDTAGNHLYQIESFLKVGLIKEAEHKVQSFKEKYPNEPKAVLLQAWVLMRQGQLEKALEMTNRSLQNDPDNATAWRLKGEIDFIREDYDRAISDFTKSKVLSDEPSARISLAKAYMQKQRYEDAMTELKTIVEAPGVSLEARSLLEQVYVRLGRKQALQALYEETLEKFPQNALWLDRAGTFAIKTGAYDKAEQLFGRILLAGPEPARDRAQGPEEALYATALEGYLRALIAGAGTPQTSSWNPARLERVFEEGRKHVEGRFAHVAYLRMAQAKLMLDDRGAAADYCRSAVDKAGTNQTLAADIMRKMYFLLGSEQVQNYCKEKLQANPDSLAANVTLFNLAKLNGQYEQAIGYIDKCIQLAGSDSPAMLDYTMKKGEILILAYDRSSDKDYLRAAIAEYESLLVKMPNNTDVATVLNNLAYLLAENNERLPEALDYVKRGLSMKPNNPVLLDTYAYVLLRNGRVSEAAESLAAALQHFEQDRTPVPADVYEHKGMIKEEQGAKAEALAAYRQALKAGENTLSERAKRRIEEAVSRVSL